MKRFLSSDVSERILFVTGLFLTCSELWKQWTLTYVLGNGNYNWWYFPFQLCSVPMYLLLLLPLFHASPRKQILITFMMDFSLLSGLGAFLDTSGMHYPLISLTCHSYLWHLLLIAIGCFCGYSGIADYTWKGFRAAGRLFFLFCGIATFLNLLVSPYHAINMFYINPYYPLSQILISDLTSSFPNPVRIFCYLSVIFLGAALIHAAWQRFFRKQMAKKIF